MLSASLFQTRLCCVSGFDVSQMRGTSFGEMSFIGSLGRKEVVSALLSQGELMVLVFGRRLGRNGIESLLLLSSLFEEWKETLLLEGCLEWGRGIFNFISLPVCFGS